MASRAESCQSALDKSNPSIAARVSQRRARPPTRATRSTEHHPSGRSFSGQGFSARDGKIGVVRYHFSGIAGAGVNPLARLMRARGHQVQGSDRSFDQGKSRDV
ncbi:MAG TPA: Mur ligase domain-containing protein, partial [Candidatus Dormibacteraeota bacterium]|nr:Mur ligase domain-containing protein [Candidatus Dormibacteraeota bacterium]